MQASTEAPSSDPPFHERFRDIDTELPDLDPWRPLHEACVRLSIQKPKDGVQMRRLAELWNGRRDVEVRLLGFAAEDLEFLRNFSGLERLNVQVPVIKDIDGLQHVAPSLKEFTLASTTARVSLKPVAACTLLGPCILSTTSGTSTRCDRFTGYVTSGFPGYLCLTCPISCHSNTCGRCFSASASRSTSASLDVPPNLKR
jgi:hypothetical protein